MWRWPSSRCPPAATAAPGAADLDKPVLDRPILDLATVVYRDELPLIRLQARSIARMLDPRGIGAILVVVNDREEEACLAALREVLPDYGPFADRVELLRPADLFALRPARLGPRGPLQRAKAAFTSNRWRYPFGVKGGWRGNRGWAVQQALKLAVARRGEAANLCILDAKNHFIRPVGVEAAFAPGLRAAATLRRKKDDVTVDRLLTRVEQGEADMLSIHRALLGRLKPEHLARLDAIWAAAGLDASELVSADAARRSAASGSQPV